MEREYAASQSWTERKRLNISWKKQEEGRFIEEVKYTERDAYS